MRSTPLFMFPAKAPGGGMSPARPSGLRWKLNLRGRKCMKKRLFSLVLTLALCLGLTVPVSASLADDYTIVTKPQLDYPIPGEPNGPLAGLTDKAGNVIIPMKYSSLSFLKNSNVLVAGNKVGPNAYDYGIIDINQNILVPFQYSMIRPMWWEEDSGYLDIEDSKTFLRGIMGPDFSIVVPAKYFYVRLLSKDDGYFAVTDTFNNEAQRNFWGNNVEARNSQDGKWGVYSTTEGLIIPCKYDNIEYLEDGYFSVRQNEVVGVVNSQDETILPLEYARYQNPLYNGIFRYGNIFIVRKYVSDEYRKRVAAGEGQPDIGELWTTSGVIDINNNILIDFGKYQTIGFNQQTDTFSCGKWTGEYVKQKYQVVGGATAYENKYEYEYIRYDSLNIPTTGTTSASVLFKDVHDNDYYAEAVKWAMEKNITSGTSATTFSPNSTCTNAQILTFLWCANGSPEPTNANAFTDIKTTDYYYKAALWAAEKGLVSGSIFDANTKCTRAMTMEYMWKAAGSPATSSKASFTDVPANADYAQAVAWAVENEITSGTGGGNFSPNATCTRGQIVTFLYRAMGK